MTTITFDTLAYVKKLREAGIDEKQAEAQAVALAPGPKRQSPAARTRWACGLWSMIATRCARRDAGHTDPPKV